MARTRGLHGYTKVGFPWSAKLHDTAHLPVASVAAVNEFGSPANGIPARPFMGQAWQNNITELRALRTGLLARIGRGVLTEAIALGILGEWFAGRVKNSILTGKFQANAQSTIDAKGSSKPLVDTAQMLGSVTHKEVY